MSGSSDSKNSDDGKSSMVNRLFKPSGKWWLLGLPVGALVFFVLGIVFWGGFNWSMELTNTEEFCTSCHEMDISYEEYQQTVHYSNASGVRASCPDCHVPKPWIHKVARKIRATTELYHTMLGTIDTPEKYEQHRQAMAESVWKDMRASDSRECRNCHQFEFMALEEQSRQAKRKHDFDKIKAEGKTCIDCHQGIAHHLPKMSPVIEEKIGE